MIGSIENQNYFRRNYVLVPSGNGQPSGEITRLLGEKVTALNGLLLKQMGEYVWIATVPGTSRAEEEITRIAKKMHLQVWDGSKR